MRKDNIGQGYQHTTQLVIVKITVGIIAEEGYEEDGAFWMSIRCFSHGRKQGSCAYLK